MLLLLSILFRKADVKLRPTQIYATDRSNTNNSIKRGRVYECGFPRSGLIKALFPEYEPVGTWLFNASLAQEPTDDILVVGMGGPCSVKQPNNRHFNGTVIYVNGEPEGNIMDIATRSNSPKWNRVYQLGPYNQKFNTKNAMQLYHIAAYLIERIDPSMWDWIFDTNQKPQNTGQHDAVIYIAKNCEKHRQQAAKKISIVIPIKFGGRCIVSTPNGNKVEVSNTRKTHWENWRIYREYKYCLVLENTRIDGYISEKILLAFLGGCIPIYWGTDQIFDLFNRDAFIFYDIDNPQKAIDEIQYLQSNATAYLEKLKAQPILRNITFAQEEIFSLTDSIGNGKLKRLIRQKTGVEANYVI